MASPMMGPAPVSPPPGVMGREAAPAPVQAQQPAGRDGNVLQKVAALLQALRTAQPQEFITAVRALGQGIQQIAQEKLPQMRAQAAGGAPAGGPAPPGGPPVGMPGGGQPPGAAGPMPAPSAPPMGRV